MFAEQISAWIRINDVYSLLCIGHEWKSPFAFLQHYKYIYILFNLTYIIHYLHYISVYVKMHSAPLCTILCNVP